MDAGQDDLAGRSYWDDTWREENLPPRLDPSQSGWRNHVVRQFHQEMLAAIDELRTPGRQLLEIGCARSAFLPYLARDFSFRVNGLDYSEGGAAQARRILEREGVEGHVTCADMFCPPSTMLGKFDVVLSYGVMEHFRSTSDALRAAAKFLVPGGLLITLVPNLAGLTGWVQKQLNRSVYDIHKPLDCQELADATTSAGLELVFARYLTSSNFGIVNLAGVEKTPSYPIKRSLQQLLVAASVMGWILDDQFLRVRRTRLFSGYVISVGRKRSSPQLEQVDVTADESSSNGPE